MRVFSRWTHPTGPHLRGPVGVLLGAVFAFVAVLAQASPHVPASDATVLERVPAAAATRQLDPLRAQVSSHPGDLQSALALARGYLQIGRDEADPRFVSYAEATLSPWLARAHPNPEVLTLAATALQYLHRFDDALKLLDRALALQWFNGQAWLTKATILQVQGRFPEARAACRPLIQINGQLVAITCLTSVNSLTGNLAGSYAALRTAFFDDSRLDPAIRVWILNELADMAQRAGDAAAAEKYLVEALQIQPRNGFTKAAYADLLLQEQRPAQVMQLLQGDEQQDNLLLRLAIAAVDTHASSASRLSDMFQARYEAARRDGDFTHLREQAMFLLEVRGEPSAAAALAVRNWQVQREPADLHILVAAASAAGDEQAKRTAADWMRQMHYEDRRLENTPLANRTAAR